MTNPATGIHQNVVPSEVGWQFVPQYYTFVNEQPNRLHCFYTKTSTFIHGTEGEDGKPCFGQQEIHNKITSIGFQDCKVFIHSVDAQASANGGIIIQVIGEMSNRGEPWRKFVQTFFLAEQPNGYFVLNDIFRFLKEDTVEDSDDAAPGEATPASAPSSVPTSEPAAQQEEQPVVQLPAAAPTDVAEPTWSAVNASYADEPKPEEIREPSPAPPAPAPVEEASPSPAPSPAPVPAEVVPPKVNGVSEHHPEPTPAPAVVEKSPTPPPAQPEPPVVEVPSPAPPTVAPPPAQAPPSPAPPSRAPPPQQQPPAPTPAPAPPQPKTWANLAAANSKKWGSAVAQEVRGTTEVLAPTATPSPGPANGAQSPVTPSRGGPPHQYQRGPKGDPTSILASITTPSCFVKGVIDLVSQATLSQVLTTRFGPIKEVEVVHSKACAFIEFQSVDSARKAILASLPYSQGGEGGIRIDVGTDSPVRINVETKKERGDRPVSRGRGGGMGNGDRGGYGGGYENRGDRGGYRGRGSIRGRGAPAGGK
ncbi:hypothetical protein PC9H_008465 [Pleurotus ostreatus]|uniref:Uncharacterized protein n=1 Tax=Pleurotus ostreatus TaxID=5322 RepID=A0A8H6ZRP1_PLEOS|nr:uncharacterized protein PC9H_008465 [Pleurotus ostreatus]KAF7426099.1 hypothetical protein PC9H_008465 [Pleurotus ostreatus]KAJ8693541.1 hypothetical protein PTI98_008526 [Pleurotus ostreatus]